MNPQIRLYNSNCRVTGCRLNGVQSRVFYKKLKQLIQKFERRYSSKLDSTSILICVNGNDIYRNRQRLLSRGIETIQDIIDYLGLENVEKIISDNQLIDKLTVIDDIYVLEIFTKGELL